MSQAAPSQPNPQAELLEKSVLEVNQFGQLLQWRQHHFQVTSCVANETPVLPGSDVGALGMHLHHFWAMLIMPRAVPTLLRSSETWAPTGGKFMGFGGRVQVKVKLEPAKVQARLCVGVQVCVHP